MPDIFRLCFYHYRYRASSHLAIAFGNSVGPLCHSFLCSLSQLFVNINKLTGNLFYLAYVVAPVPRWQNTFYSPFSHCLTANDSVCHHEKAFKRIKDALKHTSLKLAFDSVYCAHTYVHFMRNHYSMCVCVRARVTEPKIYPKMTFDFSCTHVLNNKNNPLQNAVEKALGGVNCCSLLIAFIQLLFTFFFDLVIASHMLALWAIDPLHTQRDNRQRIPLEYLWILILKKKEQ